MKKISLIMMSFALVALFAVSGCKQQGGQQQQGQPGTAPTTTPTGTGGK
jgi:hypothetical protein